MERCTRVQVAAVVHLVKELAILGSPLLKETVVDKEDGGNQSDQ